MTAIFCPRCGQPVNIEVEQDTVRATGMRLYVTWCNSAIQHECQLPPDPTQDRLA